MNRWMNMMWLAMVWMALGCVAARAQAVKVIAEGMSASADPYTARQEALADALRNAIDKGAGQTVSGATLVKDMTLRFDQIFVRSFGVVRNYTVLSAGVGDDRLYRLKIEAEVLGGDNPILQDKMAVQHLVRMRNSPRIALMIDERIEGLDRETDYSRSWFEEQAQEMGLRVVDLQRSKWQRDLQAMKDELFGDGVKATLRQSGIATEYDYLIGVKVEGALLGQETAYGSTPYQVFELGMDLRLFRPDLGEVMATVMVPGTGDDTSELRSPALAARDLIYRKLDGKTRQKGIDGSTLFTKLLTAWVTEMDLGKVIKLEFWSLGDEEYDRLVAALQRMQSKGVNSVWPGDKSPRGLSFISVETRMDLTQLKEAVLEIIGRDAYQLMEQTGHYLQFSPRDRRPGAAVPMKTEAKEPASAAAVAVAVVAPAAAPAETRPSITINQVGEQGGPTAVAAAVPPAPATATPPWLYALLGAGGILVLGGIFMLGRSSSKR